MSAHDLLLRPNYQSLPTEGRGDCAFHATFGAWNGRQFECHNMQTKRKQVARRIQLAKTGEKIFECAKEAIQAIVMEGRTLKGPHITQLKQSYQTFLHSNETSIRLSWETFENSLRQHPEVMAYIEEYYQSLDASSRTQIDPENLKAKFDRCYNNDEGLKALFPTDLAELYHTYVQHSNDDFWKDRQLERGLFQEYADFIIKQGSWLLPTEIELIAYVFDMSIDYYIKDRNKQFRCVEHYNPGKTQKAFVCFNGINHYEKIEDPNHFPNADPIGEPSIRAPEPIKKQTQTPLPSEHQLEKIEEAKVEDLKTLFRLYQAIERFLKKSADPGTEVEEVSSLLMEMAQGCAEIKWNNQSRQHIRNLYGRMCYPKKQANPDYIDFEKLSLLYRFQDEITLKQIGHVFFHAIDAFLPEMRLLSDNLAFILNHELRTHKSLSAACQDIEQELGKRSGTQKKLHALPLLSTLLDIHYDALFIQRICNPKLQEALNEIDPKTDSLRWRYTLGRVLTIIGEAAKNFSTAFKERNCHIPLETLGKLRDQIGHAHHKHIIKENPEALNLYQTIASTTMNALQEELARILQAIPKLLGKDPLEVLSILKAYEQMPIIPNHLQGLEKQPLKRPELSTEEVEALIPARIRCLKQREIRLKKISNRVQQTKQSSILPKPPSDKDAQNQKRYEEKLKPFLNRTDLTPKEKAMCESIKNELARIRRRKEAQTKAAPSSSTQQSKLPSPEAVAQESQEMDLELKTLKMVPAFGELLGIFKQRSKSQKTSPADRLKRQVISLLRECERLKAMDSSPSAIERNFAKEHCLSAIGQLMRELEECKEQIIDQIMQENDTIREAFTSNITTRNQKVMHDPFNNHTSHIDGVIQQDTLPLLPDLKALQKILNTQPSTEDKVRISIVSTYEELGSAYARLHLLPQAEEHFAQGLGYASPNRYADMHIENLGLTSLVGLPVQSVPISGAIQAVEYTERTVIMIDDSQWVNQRVKLLVQLAQCQISQEKYPEAIEHLQEALTIYEDFSRKDPIFNAQIRACYYIALARSNEKEAIALLPEIQKLAAIHPDSHANVLLHLAYKKYHANQYEEGLDLTRQIKFRKVVHLGLKINVSIINGLLFDDLAKQHEEKLAAAHPDAIIVSDVALRLRESAINALTYGYKNFKENRAQLKASSGHSVRCLHEQIINALPEIMGTQAAKLLDCEGREEEGYELIHRALKIQTKFKLDSFISYTTLATLCEKLFEITQNKKYLEEGLYAATQNTQHRKIKMRAPAYTSLAFSLCNLGRIREGIEAFFEAMFYYSKMAENKKCAADKDDEAFIQTKLEEITKSSLEIYREVLTQYELLGDQYQKNGKSQEAVTCYEKCLGGIKYLEDPEWQARLMEKYQKK